MKFKFNDQVTIKSSRYGFFDNATGIVLEGYEMETSAVRYSVVLDNDSKATFSHIFAEDELEHYVNN